LYIRLEIMMQALATSAFAALMLMATISLAPAQNQEKGSAGWSGAPKDQPTQSTGIPGHPLDSGTGKEVKTHDEERARDQPPLASGKDLNGAALQLPPSKTPD
jgi:hypothetical protein